MAVAVSLALSSPAMWAPAEAATPPDGASPQPEPASQPKPKPPARALRLSDWLLQQKPPADAYPLGLSLRLREEVPAQTGLKLELVSALAATDDVVRADPMARKRLQAWISGLPVTGRVTVASADGRWLQTNRQHDPVLTPGYSVDLPRRPRTVTVVTGDGNRCRVVHASGREAKAYIDACRPAGETRADWAWIAQPDGRVQRYGVALWNEEKQDEPAPGAWIWAPARNGGWPDTFSERFIRFLATQGPAPNGADAHPSRQSDPLSGAMPEGARGATAAVAEGFVPGGGMSMGLSEAFLAQRSPPEPPPVSPSRSDPLILRSEDREPRSRNLEVTSSDWGTVGLLQTPTARMREAGHFSFHYGYVRPYTHGNVIFQPFDWMEAGFRYTDVSNRLYGPAELSGDQSYKDKSIDVKFRAWKESAYLPEVAVGLRDIGGTGLFAGEYLVANKRTGDFDWSLGLGWGYVGARGDLRNPLGVISSAFDTRSGTTGQGGDFDLTRYFRGPTALFGGVQYQTPWQPLTLKLEYDGNDYQHEPQANNQRQSSPLNFGLVYKAWKGVDVTLGLERGNTVMLGVTLHTDLSRLTQPKVSDPAPIPVAQARPARAPDWSATAREFRRQTDWNVHAIEQRDNDVRVVVEDAGAVYWKDRVDRAAAVLHRDAPASVDKFTLTYRGAGMDVAEHVIDREAWVAQRTQPVPPSAKRETVIARSPEQGPKGETVHAGDKPKFFEHGLRLSYAQTLGGPDAFVLWQVGLVESARLRVRDDTWVQGSVRLRVVDNYDKFRYTGPSNLPRVRTFLREYLTTSTLTIPNLQATHVGKVGENHFYSAYGGLLEEMYGGVGAEWLYRPFASRLAVGVNVNAVRQREFEQHFGFRDYSVLTGHGTLHWDTGWNDVIATVSAGRYLAKDFGATLNLSRVFRNGVTIGAFATKTNVSAEEFGEGSFDKGIYVSIPFDALFTRSSRSYIGTTWKPLTRDGGAMLARSVQLYNLTGPRGDRTLWTQPAPLSNERLKATDQRVEYVPKKPPVSEPYTRVTPKTPAAQWERPGSLNEHRVASSLYAQNFRNIKVSYDPTQRVLVTASTNSLRPIGRAAGRAARTALLQAPLEARGIEVTLVDGVTPQARYEFFELDRLRRYFDGEIGIAELKSFVKVEWLSPAAPVRDPFEKLDDLDPVANPSVLATLVPDTFSVGRVANDFIGAGIAATKTDWLGAAAVGAGAVLTASLSDNRAHRYAQDHAESSWVTNGVRVGNAIPWLGFAAAGALALDGSDPRRSRTGYSAVEAGATAYAVATGLKYVVGRARPTTGLGKKEFNWLTRDDAYASFPSRHTTVAWALATPFALEYEMPWLYGVAALTNLARIGSREHWVSDTVAGSLIGYGLGRLFWQSGRDQAKGEPHVYFDGSSLGLKWGW